jgi:hypothetical protein
MADKKQEKHAELKKTKEVYELFNKKYSLPDFKFMNVNFEIETIPAEDTELFLKRIRKNITEKISSGLRAMEMFLNPQPSPIFILRILKSFSQTDNDMISDMYYKFAEFEIDAFGLENKYEEKKEADFIKKVAKEWPEIAETIEKISNSMKIGHKKESKKTEKSYFG